MLEESGKLWASVGPVSSDQRSLGCRAGLRGTVMPCSRPGGWPRGPRRYQLMMSLYLLCCAEGGGSPQRSEALLHTPQV